MTDEFDEIEVYHEKSLESENFKVMTYYNQILKNKEYVSFSWNRIFSAKVYNLISIHFYIC